MTRTPSEAVRQFDMTLRKLRPSVEGLAGKEQHRAKELEAEVHHLMTTYAIHGDEHKRHESQNHVRERLTELERLLSGQQMLFASETLAHRVASRFVTALASGVNETFKELFEIVDSLETLIEQDTMRQVGIKPAPKAPSNKPKAPTTYAKAQQEILKALAHMGWKVSDHLKIPHATAPDGFFRFWFKPQAVYFSQGADMNSFGAARSIFNEDYRFKKPDEVAKALEKIAERMSARYKNR